MNSQRNVTELRLLPGEEHEGLLLLEISQYLEQINDCRHVATKGNPNRCYQCLQNVEYLMQASVRLSTAIRIGGLFYRADL